ncbi:MAG: hypothetical protein V1767_05320 [Chloroflexota bacterium]
MNVSRFLKITLPVVAIPALIAILLPDNVWSTYVDIIEPLSLFIGSLLALYVAFSYRKELRAAFLFLSAFLFIYMLAIIFFLSFSPILLPYLRPHLNETELFSLIQSVQFVNYAMLFLFCINILKVVDITKLNRTGWLLFIFAAIYCIVAAVYPMLDLIKGVSSIGPSEIAYLIIRILDAALIIILTPVLWLYVQYLRSQQRQSLTFTVVIFGIVCATVFDYLFELIIAIFPKLLSQDSPLLATLPETLFIYGYLIIAVGLYAHRKQDDWGYDVIDRTMAGELKLVDVDDR